MKIKAVVTLDNKDINALTPFTVTGTVTNGAIAAGDCFIIERPQPYVESLAAYLKGGAPLTDFFAAFPESEKANLKLLSSTPAGSEVTWQDKEKIKITAKAAAAVSFAFKVASMKNPFSAIQKTTLDVRHYAGCNLGAPTAVDGAMPTMAE